MTDFARNGPASKRFRSYSAQQRLCRRLVQVSSVFFLPAVVMRRSQASDSRSLPRRAPELLRWFRSSSWDERSKLVVGQPARRSVAGPIATYLPCGNCTVTAVAI
jgi:hypothetical protein